MTQAAGLTVSGPRLYQHSSLVHGMPMTLRTTTGWASGMLLYYKSPQLLLLNFQVSQGSRIAATFTSHAGGDGQHGASSSRQHHTQVLACQMSLPACGLSQAQRRQWRSVRSAVAIAHVRRRHHRDACRSTRIEVILQHLSTVRQVCLRFPGVVFNRVACILESNAWP